MSVWWAMEEKGMQYMTLAEAANRLRVNKQWLHRSNAPRLRLSRRVTRFLVDDLDAWAKDRARGVK